MVDHILPDLAKENIKLLGWDKLTIAEQERLSKYFRQQVFPVLTPLAVDPAHPFPYISGNSINLAVLVENPASGKSHFARVKIPDNINRLVPVDDMTEDEADEVRYGFITIHDGEPDHRASGVAVPRHDHQGGALVPRDAQRGHRGRGRRRREPAQRD